MTNPKQKINYLPFLIIGVTFFPVGVSWLALGLGMNSVAFGGAGVGFLAIGLTFLLGARISGLNSLKSVQSCTSMPKSLTLV
jgi:hypothetical protein